MCIVHLYLLIDKSTLEREKKEQEYTHIIFTHMQRLLLWDALAAYSVCTRNAAEADAIVSIDSIDDSVVLVTICLDHNRICFSNEQELVIVPLMTFNGISQAHVIDDSSQQLIYGSSSS